MKQSRVSRVLPVIFLAALAVPTLAASKREPLVTIYWPFESCSEQNRPASPSSGST